MAKIIVCATNKGGDGKTTTSIHVAEYCALILNKRVLLIDLDPQGNLSTRYIPMERDPAHKGGKMPMVHPDFNPEEDGEWDGKSSIANIFYGEEVIPYPTDIPTLEICPAHAKKLQEAENISKHEVLEKVHLQLKRFLELEEVQQEYDYIIIDTPPSKGPLTISAFRAATHVIIPTQMEKFSIDGIYGMMQLWKQETYVRDDKRKIHLVGILANKVRDVIIHKDYYNQLITNPGIKDFVIPHKIKQRTIYTEILDEEANPQSVFKLSKNDIARKEWEEVCSYIMEKVN